MKYEAIKLCYMFCKGDSHNVTTLMETACAPLCSLLSFSEIHILLLAVEIVHMVLRKYEDRVKMFHVTPSAMDKLLFLLLRSSKKFLASSQKALVNHRASVGGKGKGVQHLPLTDDQRKDVASVLAHLTKFEQYKPYLMYKGGIPFLEQLLSIGLQVRLIL